MSDAVMADAAVALAALVVPGGVGRLGVCAADGCGRAFYDRSQAPPLPRPADVRNRVNVAAYRRRRLPR